MEKNKDGLLAIVFRGLEMTEMDDDDTGLEETGDDARWTVSRAAA